MPDALPILSRVPSDKRVTVIIPTRNRPEFLQSVINDLKRQTYRNFCVLISDNSDDSHELDRTLNGDHIPEIHFIRQRPTLTDLGSHYAAIFPLVYTEYFAVVHDDERYSRNWLQSVVMALDRDPKLVFAVGRYDIRLFEGQRILYARTNANGFVVGNLDLQGFLREGFLLGKAISVNGFAVRTSRSNEVRFKNTALEYDIEWIVDLVSGHRIICLPDILNTYTIHPGNTLRSRAHLEQALHKTPGFEFCLEILERINLKPPDVPALESTHLRLAQKARNYWILGSLWCIRAGWYDLAAEYLTRQRAHGQKSTYPAFVMQWIMAPQLAIIMRPLAALFFSIQQAVARSRRKRRFRDPEPDFLSDDPTG